MTDLPATTSHSDYGIDIRGMPMGLAIMFNDKLYERCKQIAGVMARADGFTPPHLIGKTEACFAVVTRAITWRLDPQAVAQSTYQTPGGRIGYEGKLIQAILENSGRLEGPVNYELFGEWDKVNGKFAITKSEKGKDYAKPTWTRADAKGLGVIVSAQVKGETEPRALRVNLDEMFPLNSTLWATRPSQQIKYTACRAFANTCAPGLLMGEPFDVDRTAGEMIDVTPSRPRRGDFAEASEAKQDDAAVPADPATGELPAEEVQEFGASDAYALGEEACQSGKSLYTVPQAYSDEHKEAWQAGWRSADEAKTKAA